MEQHPTRSIKLADQYLEAAKSCLELRLANPAISMAVHSAIHAKDAVYLKEPALRQFARLIASKSAAEYGQEDLPVLYAVALIQDAERFVASVQRYLSTN